MYFTRNGMSKYRVVAQQDATIALLFVSYAQRNVKILGRRATRRHHRVIVCIICATERQNSGSSRNKTPPSRYCLYHTRSGTSKDQIVAQQDATIASQDRTRYLKWPQYWTVPILTRLIESTRSDVYRTVIGRLKSSYDPSHRTIGQTNKITRSQSSHYWQDPQYPSVTAFIARSQSSHDWTLRSWIKSRPERKKMYNVRNKSPRAQKTYNVSNKSLTRKSRKSYA